MNGGFNLPPLLPKEDNLCDNCHKPLIQRSDDRLDIIENRLSVYESQTAPILEYYGKNGKSAIFVLSVICRCSSPIWYKERCCRCAGYSAIDDGSFYFVIVVYFSGMFVLVFIDISFCMWFDIYSLDQSKHRVIKTVQFFVRSFTTSMTSTRLHLYYLPEWKFISIPSVAASSFLIPSLPLKLTFCKHWWFSSYSLVTP